MTELLAIKQFNNRNNRKKGFSKITSSGCDVNVQDRIRQKWMKAGLSVRVLADVGDHTINHMDSVFTPLVQTRHEYVSCLEGCITFFIWSDDDELDPGYRPIFEALLPYQWGTFGEPLTCSKLTICPTGEIDFPNEKYIALQ